MSTTDAHDQAKNDEEKGQKKVTIEVNEQPVVMDKRLATGIEIKDAAIAQGVKIKRNFTLTEELPGDKSRVVGDDEAVKLHEESEFTAVTPDDNS